MKHIIILKGLPNSGKSKTLKYYLPLDLDSSESKRTINYKGMLVLIIRRSIHESADWEKVIDKICTYGSSYIVIAAWTDDYIQNSVHIKERLEDILLKKDAKAFQFHNYFTQYKLTPTDQEKDQRRCANEIKQCLDKIIK